MKYPTSRRELFLGGGVALLAVAADGPAFAAAAEHSSRLSAAEKANVKLVREFFASWNSPHLDIDKLMARYIAPNASVRWFDSAPAVFGPVAAAAEAKKGSGNDVRAAIDIREIFARGPLVATSRIDTIKVPGKADEIFKAVGVCIVRDGQFHEYCDYIVT